MVFGSTALLALFTASAIRVPKKVFLFYVSPVMNPLGRTIAPLYPSALFLTVHLVVAVMLALPLIVVGLLGGFLSRRLNVMITRR